MVPTTSLAPMGVPAVFLFHFLRHFLMVKVEEFTGSLSGLLTEKFHFAVLHEG
jgi:hypothetical protein